MIEAPTTAFLRATLETHPNLSRDERESLTELLRDADDGLWTDDPDDDAPDDDPTLTLTIEGETE